MNAYTKSAIKVIKDYVISLITFGMFAILPIQLGKDQFPTWILAFSIIIYCLMFTIIYADMKEIATKEKRPFSTIKPYPFKGFVVGLIGFLPFILLEIGMLVLVQYSGVTGRLRVILLDMVLAPLYPFIKLCGGSIFGYILAVLMFPVTCMLGYLAGFYRFELTEWIKKIWYRGNVPPPAKKVQKHR